MHIQTQRHRSGSTISSRSLSVKCEGKLRSSEAVQLSLAAGDTVDTETENQVLLVIAYMCTDSL